MAELIYVSNVSLDGYVEDEHGSFDCTATTTSCSATERPVSVSPRDSGVSRTGSE
jgi:hypothetical protein